MVWRISAGKDLSMNTENTVNEPINTGNVGQPALVKQIGKTTYRVRVHFSETSSETMNDKINRMLRNEISHMQSSL